MSTPHFRAIASFDPKQISGCKLWLDAQDPAGTGVQPASGSLIATWVDKSGNGNSPTQASTSYQPTFTTNVVNGNPVVRMNCATNLQTSFTSVGAVSMGFFMVERNLSACQGLGDAPWSLSGGYMGGLIYQNNNGLQPFPNSIPYTSSTARINYINFTNSSSLLTTGYQNGTLVTSYAGDSALSSWGTTLVIGYRAAGTLHSSGDLCEILIYTGVLTDPQRQQIESYLANKWGLKALLPQTHPAQRDIYPIKKVAQIGPILYSTQFTPLSVSGCQIWLDGADPAGTGVAPANNAVVSTWYDKSGKGRNATATVSGATFTAASQNGSGYITFPTGKYFTTASFIPSANNTPSIFLVCQQTGYGSGNSDIVSVSIGTPFSYYTLDIYGNSGSKNVSINMNSNVDLNGAVSIVNPTIISVVGSGSPTYSITMWGNGTPNVTFTGSANNPFSITNSFLIGAISSGFIGNIYEFLIYDTALTATQCQTIESYLAQKWGLQQRLPANHLNFTAPAGRNLPLLPRSTVLKK